VGGGYRKGGQAVGGSDAAGRGWGRRGGPGLWSGGAGTPTPAWSQGALVGDPRSCETREAGALTGGPGALCRVLNRFKPSKSIQTRSNLFQIISNLIHSKKGLPKL
jgi:hypothetical protein